jgi:hypothetical protein
MRLEKESGHRPNPLPLPPREGEPEFRRDPVLRFLEVLGSADSFPCNNVRTQIRPAVNRYAAILRFAQDDERDELFARASSTRKMCFSQNEPRAETHKPAILQANFRFRSRLRAQKSATFFAISRKNCDDSGKNRGPTRRISTVALRHQGRHAAQCTGGPRPHREAQALARSGAYNRVR